MSDDSVSNPGLSYTQADGIKGAAEVRVSSDGKFVYVTGRDDDAVTVFSRNTTAGSNYGKLSVLSGGVVRTTTSSSGGNYLDGARGMALSPQGEHVYVTAREANSLVVLNRDSSTGLLSPVPSPTQAPKQVIKDGDSTGLSSPATVLLKTPTNVIVSGDGKFVYVTAADKDTFSNASLVAFSRNTNSQSSHFGELTFLEQFTDGQVVGGVTVDGLGGAINLVLAPDGTRLFVTGHLDGDAGPTTSTTVDLGGVTVFTRDPVTGRLTYGSTERGTLQPGHDTPPNLGIDTVTQGNQSKAKYTTDVAHGRHLGDLVQIDNVNSDYNGLTRVTTAPTSTPTVFTTTQAYTVAVSSTSGTWTPKQSPMRGALGIAVSPDGKYLYTANYGIPAIESPNEAGNDGSLASFKIVSGPRVTQVTVSNASSTHSAYSVPGGGIDQMRTVPIGGGIKTIAIKFDKSVSVDSADIAVQGGGGSGTTYSPNSFSYNSSTYTATWTFSSAIAKDQLLITLNADGSSPIVDGLGSALDGEWINPNSIDGSPANPAVMNNYPSGNGLPGGNFVFRMTLLPGDANFDNTVGSGDYAIWAANFGRMNATFAMGDFDGNGTVATADYSLWAANFGVDYQDWPGGGFFMQSGGGGGGTGPIAAVQWLMSLYGFSQSADDSSDWIPRDWQDDAQLLFGWSEKDLETLGIGGFMEELEELAGIES